MAWGLGRSVNVAISSAPGHTEEGIMREVYFRFSSNLSCLLTQFYRPSLYALFICVLLTGGRRYRSRLSNEPNV